MGVVGSRRSSTAVAAAVDLRQDPTVPRWGWWVAGVEREEEKH